jgi:hypothetical protein
MNRQSGLEGCHSFFAIYIFVVEGNLLVMYMSLGVTMALLHAAACWREYAAMPSLENSRIITRKGTA